MIYHLGKTWEQATAIPDKYTWTEPSQKKTRPILIKCIYSESSVTYYRENSEPYPKKKPLLSFLDFITGSDSHQEKKRS